MNFFKGLAKDRFWDACLITDVFKTRLTTYKQITPMGLLWERPRDQSANPALI